jgi:hypothetical protein
LRAARIKICYRITGDSATKAKVQTLNATHDIGQLQVGTANPVNETFALSDFQAGDLLNADGSCDVRIYVTNPTPALVDLWVDYLWVEVDVVTHGYTSPIAISDTLALVGANETCLKVDTDLTTAATEIWEGIPYSVCEYIHHHINTIVTAGDNQTTLTTSIEETTGVTNAHWEKKSRLQMLRELAKEDATVFWLILGGTEVQWKQTTDAVHTDLTDADVLKWSPEGYDFDKMRNDYTIYGITLNDAKVAGTHNDAASIAKYLATKSDVQSTRALSTADATAMATALCHKNCELSYMLKAELAGLSSIRLGDYIEVTSTWLNLTNATYTVTKWEYNSSSYRTSITLEPRTTLGYSEAGGIEGYRRASEKGRQEQSDRYYGNLSTQTWS